MIKYLRQYTWPDMQRVITNSKLPPAECTDRLDGKLCVVTGATSGVGLAAVRRLYRFGADILMVNRDRRKSEDLVQELLHGRDTLTDDAGGSRAGTSGGEPDGTSGGEPDGTSGGEPDGASGGGSGSGSVGYLLADFRDLHQVARAAGELTALGRPIDVLINNVGIHMTRRVETPQGYEAVFAVNHLASFMITRAVLPLMVSRNHGRIIQVNSQGHRFFGLRLDDVHWHKRLYTGLRAYGAAKTAQLLCCWQFAEQLSGSAVTINAMHPGAVKTNVGINNGSLYRWYLRNFVWNNLGDPQIAGIALHYLAAAPEVAHVCGRYFNLTHLEKPAPHAVDRRFGRRVWDLSRRLVAPFEPPVDRP